MQFLTLSSFLIEIRRKNIWKEAQKGWKDVFLHTADPIMLANDHPWAMCKLFQDGGSWLCQFMGVEEEKYDYQVRKKIFSGMRISFHSSVEKSSPDSYSLLRKRYSIFTFWGTGRVLWAQITLIDIGNKFQIPRGISISMRFIFTYFIIEILK